MNLAEFSLAAVLAAGIVGPACAQDLKAAEKLAATQLGFEPSAAHGTYTLTIAGPNGAHAVITSRASAPSFDLRQLGPLQDGAYDYQLAATTDEKVTLRSRLDNGRPGGPDEAMIKAVSMSGRFDVKGGAIVKYDTSAREPVARQK